MKVIKCIGIIILISYSNFSCNKQAQQETETKEEKNLTLNTHKDLVNLFKEWRTFERPPFKAGAPDYTKAAASVKGL